MNMNDLNTQQLTHWQLRTDDAGIAWATLDRASESANTLSKAVLEELDRLLTHLDGQRPKALIIASGKSAGFVAGADIGEFTALASLEATKGFVALGWNVFERLAAVPYPTLALVRGHCLGGGLELAMACRYRVAVDEPGTKFALPEVMLGIFPGWGGMKRLPALVGPQVALDMMLTGRNVDAKKAKRLGLADECVAPRVMHNAARGLVLSGKPARRLPFMARLLNGPLKSVVANGARKQVAKKARPEHYPAPYAIIDFWQHHNGNALAAPEVMARITGNDTAKNLVRVFHLQERLKGFGKDGAFKAQRLHVVGAGVMGGDIAAVAALKGITVTLQDQELSRIAPAIARAKKLFQRRLKDKLLVRSAMDRLIPDPTGAGAAHADVVIEAIFENLDAKHALLKSLEARMKPEAVLATNTSSLKIEDLRTVLNQPERLVGIHFFNPVPMMPLVEVVEADGTDGAAFRNACAFVKQIDKLPLPVKSAPGFLVNAVLAPYMLEAMRCVDEGIAPETVDAAMEAFGMPMGPIELADTVGLDIAMAAGKTLAAGSGGNVEPPRCLADKVAAGNLGKKSGRGFYDFSSGKPAKGTAGTIPAGLAERLVAPLLAKTQQLVDDGIVADADLADAGVIFGTGFAPFTGGPLNYANQGAANQSATSIRSAARS